MNTTRRPVDRLRSGERREPRRSAKHISESLAGRVRESTALLPIPCCLSATQRWGNNNRCVVVFVLRRQLSVLYEKRAMQCSAVQFCAYCD